MMNHELTMSAFTSVVNDGIDLMNRRVYLSGDIDEESIARTIRVVEFLDSLGNDPITLVVSSYGGDLDESFSLFDTLLRLECEVRVHATGKCMSAAPLLMMAADFDRRTADRHTQFMLHSPRLVGQDAATTDEMLVQASAVQRVTDAYAQVLEDNSFRTRAHWSDVLAAPCDTYLSATEALSLGLIDKIL
jgi:ATP-dependent Clp protease protease subunit